MRSSTSRTRRRQLQGLHRRAPCRATPASSTACRAPRSRTPRPSLAEAGIPALPYHAGLDAGVARAQPGPLHQRGRHRDRRHRSRSAWASTSPTCASSRISTCRKASRPIIRRPGAPGRDGKPSSAWMAYGLSDIVQQRRMIDESTGSDAFKRVSIGKLDALVGLAETAGCRRSRLLGYFGETLASPRLRQLRQLPVAAARPRRQGRRAKAACPAPIAPGSVSAPCT